ncbi:MAG: deoxyribonuclease IV [Glycomyces artemisiae]|uniref:Probable endonuclease 4 n=1 Tax=Glycomyces artemisiae TaxID=1076443 RepID=A0A850CCQ8_9ACTN|nr:deoxyribonuclease IV [Glycomyces artemisiae]
MAAKKRPIGAHVPVGGGLVKKGLAEADAIGAEVIQIFIGSPRGWALPRVEASLAERFRNECAERKLPVYVHASYLLNLASPDKDALQKSVSHLRAAMVESEKLGALGVVVHAGSSKDGDRDAALRRIGPAYRAVLDNAPDSVRLLVEPTAGAVNSMASTFESTAEYLDAVGITEVGLCLDTCHLHAAGEPLANTRALAASLRKLTDDIGPNRIGLVHYNDSRDPQGSRRDRHATLGEGLLGDKGLRAAARTPLLKNIPLITETDTREHDVAYAKKLARG